MNVEELAVRARQMIVPGQRRILGITGSPGAGKSTVCARLVGALAGDAVLVGMDGFHLANAELERLGRADRKGAPDSFDSFGFAALLVRLRSATETVYAPYFDRGIEESIGSAVPVDPWVPLIITEGNYLLFQDDGWQSAGAALDEIWYLDVPDDVRAARLVLRHQAFGRSPADAERWVQTVDQKNGEKIGATKERADLIIDLVG
ncbi:nucleoside/nucleotide kinase family protein [Subtercola boreus]|uniref:Nucleoside/nucleotide kinase family protein n=1 Tax=Subtercola boreus TaxID=120213 RepID=A0A3E0W052_9MICO|nr:nucleoside/nucleotide kinase family protein [Subtercola boreus]